MAERTHCNQPDRDMPRTVCGYPLPCPHHTVLLDARGEAVRVHVPRAAPPNVHAARARILAIGAALKKG